MADGTGSPAAAPFSPSRHDTVLPTVLFVSSHATLGGSERVLSDLLRCLPASVGRDVVCLEDGPFVPQLREEGASVEVVPVGRTPRELLTAVLRLRRSVRRADVVHANGSKAALLAAVAAPGTPLVWMKHDVYRDGRVSRLLARRCSAVASVSAEVARDVAGSGRSSVVHPGVRVDVPAAQAGAVALRRRLGLTGPVVTVVGRLDPAKGHGELVEALPALRAALPGAIALLVGGDDPQHPGWRAALERRAAELGLADAVRLPGHVPAGAALAASDAVCVPTVPDELGRGREGFGLVAAEAMALGVPVVGYDVGATGEVLAGCGLLVPAGDRAALAGQLVRVLLDPALSQALAERGRVRAGALTPEATAAGMLALYRAAA